MEENKLLGMGFFIGYFGLIYPFLFAHNGTLFGGLFNAVIGFLFTILIIKWWRPKNNGIKNK